VKKSFNIQELFALQVQTSWNQAHAPPLLDKSLPKTSSRTPSEASWFGGSENKTKNKTNYLPS
jgi:hypothetical protein